MFYHIATTTGYQLERFDVDGLIHPSAMMFGGIDYEIVKKYFNAHPGQVKLDYMDAVHAAYELAVSEKIGGNLVIANQSKGHISLSQRKLRDSHPLRGVTELLAAASNIVGQHLEIHCPDINGGVHKVAIDSMGLFQYNGRYYMAGDGGGKIGMDHHWGIFGGSNALFDVTDTGYVKPSFIGDDGDMILDKDGFPKDTDFLLGMKGKHFFRGTIHAEAGKFKGVVQAENFMLKSGDSMQSILSDKGKIMGDYIDARGINILDDDGDPIFYIDKTGIHWTQKHNPIKSQFSTSINGSWHDEFATNDEYRRDTSDGGTTWSAGYKFVAKDGLNGSNGSDASVNYENMSKILEKYYGMSTTQIDPGSIYSPYIYGANLMGGDYWGGDGRGHMKIGDSGQFAYFWLYDSEYLGGKTPAIAIGTAGYGEQTTGTMMMFQKQILRYDLSDHITRPLGTWDFGEATTRGVTAVFA